MRDEQLGVVQDHGLAASDVAAAMGSEFKMRCHLLRGHGVTGRILVGVVVLAPLTVAHLSPRG